MTISQLTSQTDEPALPAHRRGRTFTTTAGPVVLLAPDSDDTWTVLTTTGLETLVIGSPDWDDDTDDDTLLALLVQAWNRLKETADRSARAIAGRDELITDIRAYAIDRHRDGEYCRDGLNRALEHFGLDPYEPRFRVTATVTGTFDINADDEDDARRRVRYLIDGISHSGEEATDDLDVTTDDIDISDAEAL